MNTGKIPAFALGFCSLAALFFLVACPTTDEPTRVLNMQIDKDNDSLLHFDSVIVKVCSKDSSFVQEVFHGKLTDAKQVLGMPLDSRMSKEYTVSIIGYKSGKVGVNKQITILGVNNYQSKNLPVQGQDTIKIEPTISEILGPADTSIAEGDSLRFRVTVRNPMSGATTLTLKDTLPGASLDTTGRNPGDALFTWKPNYNQGRSEPYAVTFVYASAERRVEKTVSMKILNVNRPPKFAAIVDQMVKENEILTFKVEATDPDLDSLTFTATGMPTGATFVSGSFTWKPAVGQAGNYSIKFKAYDGRDSDLVAVLITVGNVDPPPALSVKITTPSGDTAINFTPITVFYKVNGILLQKVISLQNGRNKIFVDTTILGRTAFDTVTITLDVVPPAIPIVRGLSPINILTPTWTWSTGGGGSGIYRYQLDIQDFTSSPSLPETTYTSTKNLDPGIHTLYVQERDAAGNWSPSGQSSIRIDTTRPAPPIVSIDPASPTNNTQPAWKWSGQGDDIKEFFRYKLDDTNLLTGATETKGTSYAPGLGQDLKEGVHILYVQQQDSAGNWSAAGNAQIKVDLTPPNSPIIKTSQTSPTNVIKPDWSWTSGGNGGMGTFRLKFDDSLMSVGSTTGNISSFSPDTALQEGVHILYVQERDSAGNWSKISSQLIRVDLTPPSAPVVSASSWHTINPNPTWTWTSGGNGGSGVYRCKLNDSSMQSGAISISDSIYSSTLALAVGSRNTLYVQERDSAGNWSQAGSLSIRVHGQTGYAVGLSGLIVKTINNGTSWNLLRGPNSFPIYTVYFTDAYTGFFGNALGKIYKTSNGGTSWDTTTSGTSQSLRSIFFTSASTGYAAGYGGTIVKTLNGGTAWALLSTGTAQALKSIYFIDANTGYAAGEGGTIIKTTNAGSSWSPLAKPIDSIPDLSIYSIYFTTASNGYAAGNGAIIRTIDGGKTWSPVSGITVRLYTSVYFTDSNIGYAVGQDGFMLKTTDGGSNWKELVKITTKHLFAVYFTDSNTGFAAGLDGTMIQTTDGGKNSAGYVIGSDQINGICFP